MMITMSKKNDLIYYLRKIEQTDNKQYVDYLLHLLKTIDIKKEINIKKDKNKKKDLAIFY